MRIVMVDDDVDLSALTQKVLMRHGHDALTFSDVAKALQQARQQKPHLILMDVMLPGLSGPEIVADMQNDPILKTVPVVFLTGLVSGREKSVQNEGIQVRGIKYRTLGKPFEIEDLLEVITQAVREGK